MSARWHDAPEDDQVLEIVDGTDRQERYLIVSRTHGRRRMVGIACELFGVRGKPGGFVDIKSLSAVARALLEVVK